VNKSGEWGGAWRQARRYCHAEFFGVVRKRRGAKCKCDAPIAEVTARKIQSQKGVGDDSLYHCPALSNFLAFDFDRDGKNSCERMDLQQLRQAVGRRLI
jgi:hypothetical protein